eukprot:IDg4393t1
MYSSIRTCPVVEDFGAGVPVAVQGTIEWQERISQFHNGWRDHRWSRSWSWRYKLESRADGLVTPFTLCTKIAAEVAFARSRDEKTWAELYYEKCQDQEWALSLSKFDPRALEGLAGPGKLSARMGEAFKLDARRRRDSRRWRHELDIVVPGFFGECEVLQRSGVRTARYPRCPEGFGDLEVPYGMYVEAPSGCRTLRDVGRLWRLSPTLLEAMETIGLTVLVGGDLVLAKKLEDLISWNRWVKWRLVDPELSTRPRRNDISAPVYAGGDFVWFDAIRWGPKVPVRLLGEWEPYRKEEILLGDLSAYRWASTGRGRPSVDFEGELVRGAVMVKEWEEEVEKGVDHSDISAGEVDDDRGPAHKRRRVEEEPLVGAVVDDQEEMEGQVGPVVVPALGKRKRVAKEERVKGPELRFILIDLIE